jgi:hypothetical protein
VISGSVQCALDPMKQCNIECSRKIQIGFSYECFYALQYGPTCGSWSKTVDNTIVAECMESVDVVVVDRSVKCELDPTKKVTLNICILEKVVIFQTKKSNQHLNFEVQARCDFTLFLDPIRKNNDDEGRRMMNREAVRFVPQSKVMRALRKTRSKLFKH